MSDEFIQTLAEMMGVFANSRQVDEFLYYRWVGECEIDTSLIQADGTDSVRDGSDNLASENDANQKLTS